MNIYYRLYLDQILLLVSSLVVKSEHAVRQMNTYTRLNGIEVNDSLPRTWKYYMNLNGDYHVLDKPMMVTSQDTFEQIPFTKEMLEDHLITKRSYRELGRFYKALVAEYPSQELLIKGILSPVEYSKSIDVRDHKILGYDSSLVEIQEQFLIPEIQNYIDGFYDRWYNVDYHRVESNYDTYMMAMLYAALPMQIVLARKRRRYTDLAHSYHIRMYLLSFSKKVGDEFNYLSKSQKLWLYRNIRYLNLNIGSNETLEEVVLNIMNARGFPVVATELEFDYEDLHNQLDPGIKTYGVDIGRLHGESLNVGGIDDILGRQLIKAPMNTDYRAYDRERFETKYLNGRFDKLTTKVLESNIVDKTDAEPFTFKSVILNYWPFLAAAGYYNSKVSITVPSTGQTHQLDMLEAFVLYVYCVTAFDNVFLDRIPCIYIQRVLRLIPPRNTELEALRASYTPKYFLEYISREIPVVQRMISVIAFNEKAMEIHRTQNDLRTMRHFQRDFKVEGNLHQIIDRYYHSTILKPFGLESYSGWFENREIEISQWIRSDFIEVAGELYEKCTGTSMGRGSALKDLHASMIRIMDELTSYSVHMLTTVNDDSIKILDTKFPKSTVPVGVEQHEIEFDINAPTILELSQRLKHRIDADVEVPLIREITSNETDRYYVPTGLTARATSGLVNTIKAPMTIPTIRLQDKTPVDVDLIGESEVIWDSSVEPNPRLVGDLYTQLTPQRMALFLRR